MKVKIISLYDREQYQLQCGDLSIVIDPNDGMTITSFTIKEKEYIWYSKERYESGATYGIPILYPTPNRVKDSLCKFKGDIFEGVMHGITRKQGFSNIVSKVETEQVVLSGELIFDETKSYYKTFPYNSMLKVTIILSEKGISWEYEVINQDEKPLGFGIALHPFFVKEDGCEILTNAITYMNADEDKYPDGSYQMVENTIYDLRTYQKSDSLDIDTVFYHPEQSVYSKLRYSDLELTLAGDDRCNHCVIYTPKNQPFLCLEPQTCSTDCHNLYEQGFLEESNLIVVKAGQCYRGKFSLNLVTIQPCSKKVVK